MRVIFMGTPEFAVPSLIALDEAYDVVGVVTRPDAVRGRGKRLEPSPVKAEAQARALRVIETNRITPEVMGELSGLGADIVCVAAYGCILPDLVLAMAPLGCVNVHASLLPRPCSGPSSPATSVRASRSCAWCTSSMRVPTARRPPRRWPTSPAPSSWPKWPSLVRGPS